MGNPAYTKKHWFVLIAVAMMMGSSLGLLTNGNGVFFAPMARNLDVPLGSISLHTTFKAFSTAFVALTIPQFIERFGHKKLLFVGVAAGTLGTFFMGYAENLPTIYILGAIRGIGTAYYSLVPMAMILTRWFDKKIGLATGLASGTSGIIGSIFAPILTLLIESIGWRYAFFVKSLFILLLGLPILLLPFELDPTDEQLLPYGYENNEKDSGSLRVPVKNIGSLNVVLIILLLVSFLNTFIIYMNSHFPGYGESVGLSPERASLMLSAAMIGNLVWKAIYGLLSDWMGPVNSAIMMTSIPFLAILSMILFQEPILLIVSSFFFGGTFAISGVALPLLSNYYFGPVTGGKVFAKVNFLSAFGGAIGVAVTGYIFDYTGSYVPAFIIALAFFAINGCLLFAASIYFKKHTLS